MSRRVLVLPATGGPCPAAILFCISDGAINTASWLSLLSRRAFMSRRIDLYFALFPFERACAGHSVRSTTVVGAWLGSLKKPDVSGQVALVVATDTLLLSLIYNALIYIEDNSPLGYI